jgi:hypothetical protein
MTSHPPKPLADRDAKLVRETELVIKRSRELLDKTAQAVPGYLKQPYRIPEPSREERSRRPRSSRLP